MKQSSIEWLEERLNMSLGDDIKSLRGFFVLAEEIHKEEIMDAHFYGQRLHAKSVTNTMMENNAEGYYNETFNTKEK